MVLLKSKPEYRSPKSEIASSEVRDSRFEIRAWGKEGAVAAVLVSVALMAGFSHGGPAGPLVWPPPPAPAKIEFVKSISGSRDVVERKGLAARLGGIIFGKNEEWMVRPVGIAAGGGVIYVADGGGQALFMLDLKKGKIKKIRKAGREELHSPVGLALDKEGGLYLSDSYSGKVYLFTAEGDYSGVFPAPLLQRPTGLAYDSSLGRLYVVETKAHRVSVFARDGKPLFNIGGRGSGEGEFNFPTFIALDEKGNVYVTDSLNYRVQIFDNEGKFLHMFGKLGDGSGDFANPKGVGVDPDGHVYVADSLFDSVQIFNTKGDLLLWFGQRGIKEGEFWLPTGLFLDEEGNIYVADSYNQRVQIFRYLGGNGE